MSKVAKLTKGRGNDPHGVLYAFENRRVAMPVPPFPESWKTRWHRKTGTHPNTKQPFRRDSRKALIDLRDIPGVVLFMPADRVPFWGTIAPSGRANHYIRADRQAPESMRGRCGLRIGAAIPLVGYGPRCGKCELLLTGEDDV
jgi:hypothetical protein